MKLQLQVDSKTNVFFISDLHLFHDNICKGSSKWGSDSEKFLRPFNNGSEMAEKILKNINDTVKPEDHLFLLGDISFNKLRTVEILDQIKCKNIYLVLGNHDKDIETNKTVYKSYFKCIADRIELEITTSKTTTTKYILDHYPIFSWKGLNRGVILLHGHIHSPLQYWEDYPDLNWGKHLDVGCESMDYKPISYEEVNTMLKNNPLKPFSLPSNHKDHHENFVR